MLTSRSLADNTCSSVLHAPPVAFGNWYLTYSNTESCSSRVANLWWHKRRSLERCEAKNSGAATRPGWKLHALTDAVTWESSVNDESSVTPRIFRWSVILTTVMQVLGGGRRQVGGNLGLLRATANIHNLRCWRSKTLTFPDYDQVTTNNW